MSHRKFEAPRHGSLGFLPRKRCRLGRGKIKAFPKDYFKGKPRMTGFIGWKAGLTTMIREVEKPGSKVHNKEVAEVATIIETPPMTVIGLTGYKKTHRGMKKFATIWAKHISAGVKKREIKQYWANKNTRSFKHVSKRYGDPKIVEKMKVRMVKNCDEIRAICHTQMVVNKKKRLQNVQSKKDPIMEFRIIGGCLKAKADWVTRRFEQEVRVKDVFKEREALDTISITRGKGFKGVTSRWGTKKLPRKTHKGLRKVACIGAWHPARVSWTVARAGQKGYHHRTQINKKIIRIGNQNRLKNSGSTEGDLTQKSINPMGGFVSYGYVKHDFVMIKGNCVGPRRRMITLRKSLFGKRSRCAREKVHLKLIDTGCKRGAGLFQTTAEKKAFMGPTKKEKQLIVKAGEKKAAAATAATAA